MNEKGNLILLVILAFGVVLIIPPIVIELFPPAKWAFAIIMMFVIFSTIRQYLGDGVITWVLSAVFIYFLVFKYLLITASLWVFQLLLAVGFSSVVMWSISLLPKPLPKIKI